MSEDNNTGETPKFNKAYSDCAKAINKVVTEVELPVTDTIRLLTMMRLSLLTGLAENAPLEVGRLYNALCSTEKALLEPLAYNKASAFTPKLVKA